MSHFYGVLQGSRGEVTRCGTVRSGVTTYAAGWQGAIKTTVWHDSNIDLDCFRVEIIPWQGSGGETQVIATGELNSRIKNERGEYEEVVK